MENYLIWKKEAEKRRVLKDIVYDLKICLMEKEYFAGKVKVEFWADEDFSDLWMDFNGFQVCECRVNLERVEVKYENFRIVLGGVKKGKNIVEVEYLNRYSGDGFGLHYFEDRADGKKYVYSHFEPFSANRAFPCFDQPDLKAIFNLWVKAPEKWKVISTELPSNVTDQVQDFPDIPNSNEAGPELVHIFPGKFLTSTYIFPICAGEFSEFHDATGPVPLRIYCRSSMTDLISSTNYFSFMKSALIFYSDFFSYNYPFSKLDLLFVPEFVIGAMENIACMTFNEHYLSSTSENPIFNQSICNIICHEISHMWFGNLVSILWWDDIWLKESFATFMASLCIDHTFLETFPNVWEEFCRSKTWGYNTDQLTTTHPICTEVKNTSETRTNFDGISYSKGSAVLKQLYFLAGENVFRAACAKFIKKFEFGVASCKDFIECFESESRSDFSQWTESWLLKAGLNVLEPRVVFEDGKISECFVEQSWGEVGDRVLREHFIYVEVFDAELKSVFKEKVRVLGDRVRLERFLGIGAAAVLINAEDWGYCKVKLDVGSWNVIRGSMFKLQSPLNRMILYRALLMMVKDLALSGVEYIDCLLDQILKETEPSAATTLLEDMNFVLFNAVPSDQLDKLSRKVFKTIKEKIRTEQDRKVSIVYKTGIFSFLYSQKSVSEAVEWVRNNQTGIEGFSLSLDDKSLIIQEFACFSHEAMEVFTECLGSTSRLGLHLAALNVEGRRPTRESKQAVWEKISNAGSGLSRYERKNLMSGFNDRRQGRILQEFEQAFFDTLKNVVVSQDKEFAIDYCLLLVPNYVEESLIIPKLENVLQQVPKESFEVFRVLTEKLEKLKLNKALKSFASN